MFPTLPFPVKPPPIARNSYRAEGLATAQETTAEHAQACHDLIERNDGGNDAGPFLGLSRRRRTHQELARLPGWFRQGQLGGIAWGPNSRYAFVVSQDVGAFGWIEKTKEGSYDRATLDGAGPEASQF